MYVPGNGVVPNNHLRVLRTQTTHMHREHVVPNENLRVGLQNWRFKTKN